MEFLTRFTIVTMCHFFQGSVLNEALGQAYRMSLEASTALVRLWKAAPRCVPKDSDRNIDDTQDCRLTLRFKYLTLRVTG